MLGEAALDAVVVCTPHDAHAEPTIAALEAGHHVLVEKPMALTTRDAEAMVAAADRAGRTLMVGTNARGRGLWRAARQQLNAGAIGRMRQINAVYYTDNRWMWEPERRPEWVRLFLEETEPITATLLASALEWRGQPAHMGGGMFVDIGAHLVDTMLWLADGIPKRVMAFTEAAGLPVDCFLSAQAVLTNGVQLTCSYGAGVAGGETPLYGQGRLTITGDRGGVFAEWRGYNLDAVTALWVEQEGVRTDITAVEEDTTAAAAFVATILDGTPNLCPGDEGARAVAFTESVYRAATTGSVVEVAS